VVLDLEVDLLEELLVKVVLFVLVGGQGMLAGLDSGELDVWGPLELFAGVGGVGELVVSQCHAIGVGVGIGGSVPVELVG